MIAAAAIVIPLLGLLPYAKSDFELARLRNAVLLEAPLPPSFDWAAAPSADFVFDRAPFDPYFTALAAQLKLAALPDDWSRALAIGSHLLGSAPLKGGGVQDSLKRTHRAITERGDGYCADFIDVFQAIASAAGLQVRAWAFSFDGFGGHGHIFIELWNRDLKRWQLIDLYNNFTFAVDGGAHLSAREFREVMTREPERLQLRSIEPRAPAGYSRRDKAIAYYQRGLDEWYLFWGSQVLASEQSLAYRALAPLSQTAGEAAAMLAGGTPRVRPWPTATNAERIDALRRVKLQLWATAVAVAAGIALWLALIVTRGRGRHDATSARA